MKELNELIKQDERRRKDVTRVAVIGFVAIGILVAIGVIYHWLVL